MDNLTQHTIRLQDGSLFSFNKRFAKRYSTLLGYLTDVPDPRKKYGKRYPLSLMLLILFAGITSGQTSLKNCHLWALTNRRFLVRYIPLSHGIPDPTTISRAIQKVDMGALVKVYLLWKVTLFGREKEVVASFDGKTMRGIHGAETIKHILSLFTHKTHQILGQVGVTRKENEIPAVKRLFYQVDISGMILVADALHTQKETVRLIRENNADYVFVVKENQKELSRDLSILFADKKFVEEEACEEEFGHHRYIETKVELIKDPGVLAYFSSWKSLALVGRVRRYGERYEQERRQNVDETIYCISSKGELTAKKLAVILRNHWSIENNLHWQKDYTLLEDRQTLRRGNAPQVMTFLRSMAISLFSSFNFASITAATANFQMNPYLHHTFLELAYIV